MYRRARSSRVTGPKIRVPIGSSHCLIAPPHSGRTGYRFRRDAGFPWRSLRSRRGAHHLSSPFRAELPPSRIRRSHHRPWPNDVSSRGSECTERGVRRNCQLPRVGSRDNHWSCPCSSTLHASSKMTSQVFDLKSVYIRESGPFRPSYICSPIMRREFLRAADNLFIQRMLDLAFGGRLRFCRPCRRPLFPEEFAWASSLPFPTTLRRQRAAVRS